ncbi:MAG: sodium:proton antiporter [Endomicrobiia bacterium]|nr:sodium:proton antiporter [Endomicrobiia bacterium]
MINYFLVFVLFGVGLYGVLVKKNIVKKILGLAIFTYAVNLFFVLIGYKAGGAAPIFAVGSEANFVDPLPQAIVLTAIVIDLAILALAVAIALRIYEKHGTFDITEIRNLKG